MKNFCTLFDKNYLSKGLAMYESLSLYLEDFHLYIFALDNDTLDTLQKLNLNNTTTISLHTFEDSAMKKMKLKHTWAEYCFSCSASSILFVFQNFTVDNCTYIDSDVYFFASPQVLLDEMTDKSILITEHRFSIRDISEPTGRYCVQFMTFKKIPESIQILNNWRQQCVTASKFDLEHGLYYDQKYIDDWATRYQCVHELKNLGGGIAPWNIQQYEFTQKDKQVLGQDKISKTNFQAIFYHFHGLKFYNDGKINLTGNHYKLSQNNINIFYKPYINHLLHITEKLKNINSNQSISTEKSPTKLKVLAYFIKEKAKDLVKIFKHKPDYIITRNTYNTKDFS
jgi:hypothetical protein